MFEERIEVALSGEFSGPQKSRCFREGDSSTEFRDKFHLFGGGVLGDCLGTLGDGVLGEFTW